MQLAISSRGILKQQRLKSADAQASKGKKLKSSHSDSRINGVISRQSPKQPGLRHQQKKEQTCPTVPKLFERGTYGMKSEERTGGVHSLTHSLTHSLPPRKWSNDSSIPLFHGVSNQNFTSPRVSPTSQASSHLQAFQQLRLFHGSHAALRRLTWLTE